MIYEHKVIKNIHFPASLLFEIKKQKCNWKHPFPVKQPPPPPPPPHIHTPRKKSASPIRLMCMFLERAHNPHTQEGGNQTDTRLHMSQPEQMKPSEGSG